MNSRFLSLVFLLALSCSVFAQERDLKPPKLDAVTPTVELNFHPRYTIDAVLAQIMLDAQLRKFANLLAMRDDDEIHVLTSDRPANDPELVQRRKRLQKAQELAEKLTKNPKR